MSSIFEASWDSSYARPGTRNVSQTFFRCDNGYDTTDIQRIAALAVGEHVELDASHHIVKRVR
jgi:hypothetical protein